MANKQTQPAPASATAAQAPAETDVVLIYASTPDLATAERIADALLTERLIACANILPSMTSLYR